MRINLKDYTHHASFYGIPCYFKDEGEGCLLTGKNVLFEALLPVATFIHNYFIAPFNVEWGFPIRLKGEIEKD